MGLPLGSRNDLHCFGGMLHVHWRPSALRHRALMCLACSPTAFEWKLPGRLLLVPSLQAEQLNALLDAIYDGFVSAVCESKGKTPDEVCTLYMYNFRACRLGCRRECPAAAAACSSKADFAI